MADTFRLRSALVSLLADNATGDISPQDVRDFLLTSMLRNVIEITNANSPYTLDDDDCIILADATAGVITINLPPLPADPTVQSYKYLIKKIDASANAVTIDGNAAETIEGAATKSLATQYTHALLVNGTAEWYDWT